MRQSPSIVPLDRLARDIYLVLEDFGARAGCSWRETDEQDTDFETIIRDLISGQYAYPIRIVAFNAVDGWCRDATSEVADELGERAAGTPRSRRPCRPSSRRMLPGHLLSNWRFHY